MDTIAARASAHQVFTSHLSLYADELASWLVRGRRVPVLAMEISEWSLWWYARFALCWAGWTFSGSCDCKTSHSVIDRWVMEALGLTPIGLRDIAELREILESGVDGRRLYDELSERGSWEMAMRWSRWLDACQCAPEEHAGLTGTSCAVQSLVVGLVEGPK